MEVEDSPERERASTSILEGPAMDSAPSPDLVERIVGRVLAGLSPRREALDRPPTPSQLPPEAGREK